MFRLEKLEINGFKSFADRTTLVFGEGITCVVGPNGCGKSNVAEAISWVLGEQSAKNLRGGKMEDVIFNGTRDRKPTGLAEVLLTMVAIEDITVRDDEEQNSEEHEFDQALTSAERASQAARALVEEMTPAATEAPADASASVRQQPAEAPLAARQDAARQDAANGEVAKEGEASESNTQNALTPGSGSAEPEPTQDTASTQAAESTS